ncbi:MAG: formate dehydrogenase accessory protein FdhE [candidate division Zixibacteria bacterium]|nr:formate dehydrogenase accessory protein FdhE [candidate division Zixibacteria bacterium]
MSVPTDHNIEAASVEAFLKAYREGVGKLLSSTSISELELSQRVASQFDNTASGIPLFAGFDASLDGAGLARIGFGLEKILYTHVSDIFHNFVAALSGDETPEEALSRLVRHTLKGDVAYFENLSRERSIPADRLAFFGNFLVRPIRQRARHVLESAYDLDQWHYSYCPVCGLWPQMARLEEEFGQRHLWCIGCTGQWSFPRMRCPFCLEDNQEKLGYLTVEGWEGYRIQTCDNCHHYLKTRDERQPEPKSVSDFDIEYLGTTVLDAAATREGYCNDFIGLTAFNAKDPPLSRTYRQKL